VASVSAPRALTLCCIFCTTAIAADLSPLFQDTYPRHVCQLAARDLLAHHPRALTAFWRFSRWTSVNSRQDCQAPDSWRFRHRRACEGR
jgi:hypothetical protein